MPAGITLAQDKMDGQEARGCQELSSTLSAQRLRLNVINVTTS